MQLKHWTWGLVLGSGKEGDGLLLERPPHGQNISYGETEVQEEEGFK